MNNLIDRLWELGWFAGKDVDRSRLDNHILESVLKEYQKFFGIEPSGEACEQTTISVFSGRFCACPDIQYSVSSIEDLPKWPTRDLRWHLQGSELALKMSPETIKSIFARAWKAWSDVCGIRPILTDREEEAQVLITFGSIDGARKVLAWSELADGSIRPKHQRFDANEDWVDAETTVRSEVDLLRVATHEIGHVLGVPHLPSGSLMQPMYDNHIRYPKAADIVEMVNRYGGKQ